MAFFGVPLSAGEHTVRLRYRPKSLVAGLLISMASGVLLVVTARRLRV